jgi:phosphopantothenoylcysteine synthetase/decarboxylase
MIVLNSVEDGKVFNSDYNEVSVLTKNGQYPISFSSKREVAGKILDLVFQEQL